MTLTASVAQAQALDGREAALQAAHHALNHHGPAVPGLAIVIASYQYQAREVASGIAGLLGDTPVIGFSTPAGLTSKGQHPHSVVVALLSGDFQAEAHWLPGYAQSSRETAGRLLNLAGTPAGPQSLLFFADGFNGDAEQLCNSLGATETRVFGALSSGDLHTGNTYQISGNQTGSGALAAAFLRGRIRMGIGSSHGWDRSAASSGDTSRGFWLRTLDGPAGFRSRAPVRLPAGLGLPPLSHLARLYPLKVEQGDSLVVRADHVGGWQFPHKQDGARWDRCVHGGRPGFVRRQQGGSAGAAGAGRDQAGLCACVGGVAWQMLLKADPGAEISAVQDILGPNVAVAGGYTLGQITPQEGQAPGFLNQHMLVAVFGEE
jgi:hypothetical protein